MSQTTYKFDPGAGVAGQVVSSPEHTQIDGRYKASEEIPPGLMTELHTDGKLRLYRGGKKAGVAIYRDAKDPGAWEADEHVPILRRGQIWAQCAGNPGADLTRANFAYADTTTTDRGKATNSVPSNASDAQVYGGGSAKFIGDTHTATSGLALLECNFGGEHILVAEDPILVTQLTNNFAINPKNGGVYELNTTAANSTVSLNNSAPDGTTCYIVADGVKNAHTLTFRDGTTPISAATTASKRVAVVATKAGGAWAVQLTVGP